MLQVSQEVIKVCYEQRIINLTIFSFGKGSADNYQENGTSYWGGSGRKVTTCIAWFLQLVMRLFFASKVLCHVIRFSKSDFISADAMSKLRQKNPGAIRTPEEDKGLETFLMDSRISVGANAANAISPHINRQERASSWTWKPIQVRFFYVLDGLQPRSPRLRLFQGAPHLLDAPLGKSDMKRRKKKKKDRMRKRKKEKRNTTVE